MTKRYEIDATDQGGTEYQESPKGYWVKYEDHERIVGEQARIIEELEEDIKILRERFIDFA